MGATSRRGSPAAAHPRHRCLREGEGQVEVGGQRSGRLLGAQLALVHVDHVAADAPQGIEDLADAGPRRHDGVGDGGRHRAQAATLVGNEAGGESVAGTGEASGEALVGHDPAHRAGQCREAAGAHGEAGGIGDHVLELVGLVEHHDVVLGQERPAAGHVHAVEMGVDDHHVGRRRPGARVLGETLVTEGAARRTRALLGGHAHRLPRRQSSSAWSPVSLVSAHRARRSTSARVDGRSSSPSDSWASTPPACSCRRWRQA